jgi:hypothetical protein
LRLVPADSADGFPILVPSPAAGMIATTFMGN